MKPKKWRERYTHDSSKCLLPGDYEAWITGIATPDGRSVAVWEIRRKGSAAPDAFDAKASGEANSNAQRATVAAAVGVLDMLSKGSTVTIYTRNTYVADGVNRDAVKWRANGWKSASGSSIAHEELWQPFLQARDEKHVNVKAIFSDQDSEEFSRLRERAHRIVERDRHNADDLRWCAGYLCERGQFSVGYSDGQWVPIIQMSDGDIPVLNRFKGIVMVDKILRGCEVVEWDGHYSSSFDAIGEDEINWLMTTLGSYLDRTTAAQIEAVRNAAALLNRASDPSPRRNAA